MSDFTVIGFYPNTMQRFAESYRAPNPESAEKKCFRQYPEVAICGVVKGRHNCVDSATSVTFETEGGRNE